MKIKKTGIYCFTALLFMSFLSSCVNTKKVTYFNDVTDSARILSKASLEPVIQKKDILEYYG